MFKYVKTIINTLIFSTAFVFAYFIVLGENVKQLPHCSGTNGSGVVLVSTLDGKLTALNSTGGIVWGIDTGPGPLLYSNIHELELTNNGEWIRIIPSLSGTLYKFDGSTIDPIPITAESLLKSSFKYSDDLVIAGGTEKRTYGVDFWSGDIMYECTPSECSNNRSKDGADILVVERSTHTVRAVEPRTGHERWNFSVGLHNVKLIQDSCLDANRQSFNWNITAVLPDGILKASVVKDDVVEQSWQYKFTAPIVHVWRWTGKEFIEINLFAANVIPKWLSNPVSPSIYVGMHKKQLYIHESVAMQGILQNTVHTDLVVAESHSLAKIPWKPIPASDQETEDDSTALSVLNASEYVNGKGFYLHSDEPQLCGKNNSIEEDVLQNDEAYSYLFVFMGHMWYWCCRKEFFLIMATSILLPLFYKFLNQHRGVRETVYHVPEIVRHNSERESESSDSSTFNSRYMGDFDTIRCLGKGGFGVVFEVKQKIDECKYAIKRITLPNEKKSRDRVMREVKILAKLDHQNIVRYFNSWVEHPPLGWQQEHDQKWIPDTSSFISSKLSDFSSAMSPVQHASTPKRAKSLSISIDIPGLHQEQLDFSTTDKLDDSDDFIVFENTQSNPNCDPTNSLVVTSLTLHSQSTSSLQDTTTTNTTSMDLSTCSKDGTISEHAKRKINWRKPSRRHHSWDQNVSNNIAIPLKEPPMFLYIQMQLCQDQSLKEWLINNQKRDYKKIVDTFLQILKAVEYVHLQGLIHRDLKPSNIFFALDGQVKVGDFGLVKDMEDTLDDSRKSSPSHRGHTVEVGTQLYMSPEQFHSRRYNYKVDIYSLGLILFEMLVPFSTDMERIKTLTNLKKNDVPKEFAEKFPDEYNLLSMMLCEDPNQRLTTIGIKARPPYNINDPLYNKDYHFCMPVLQKC